jgi:hypothetical protein
MRHDQAGLIQQARANMNGITAVAEIDGQGLHSVSVDIGNV